MGKSYTLLGDGENLGIFQRSVMQIFKLIKIEKKDIKYRVYVNVSAVYKKAIIDVLSDKDNKISFRCDHGCNLDRTYTIGNIILELKNVEDVFMIVKKINNYKNSHKDNWEHMIINISLEKWSINNDNTVKSNKTNKNVSFSSPKNSHSESINSFIKRRNESIFNIFR